MLAVSTLVGTSASKLKPVLINDVEKLKKIAKLKNTCQSQVISDLINFIKI